MHFGVHASPPYVESVMAVLFLYVARLCVVVLALAVEQSVTIGSETGTVDVSTRQRRDETLLRRGNGLSASICIQLVQTSTLQAAKGQFSEIQTRIGQ